MDDLRLVSRIIRGLLKIFEIATCHVAISLSVQLVLTKSRAKGPNFSHLTNLLTKWSRVLQKLTVTQLVKKFPAVY